MTELILKTEVLKEMSFLELLNYKNKLIRAIFEIDVPLSEDEITHFEFLSAQCDILDTLI